MLHRYDLTASTFCVPCVTRAGSKGARLQSRALAQQDYTDPGTVHVEGHTKQTPWETDEFIRLDAGQAPGH